MNVRNVAYSTSGDHSATAATATAKTKTKPADANAAMVQAITADIMFTLDGTTPTAAIGFLLDSSATGPIIIPAGEGITTLSFIRAGGSDGVLQLQWLRN